MRLWAFETEHAGYLWNHLPNANWFITPMEIYTATNQDPSVLRNEKVWECPAYVLDPRLQDGNIILKWEPRKILGQYMGKSPKHASLVGLIRNLKTCFISPQFHVPYDNIFQTVMGRYEDSSTISHHIWNVLLQGDDNNIHNTVDRSKTDQERFPLLHTDWLTTQEIDTRVA